MFQNLTPRGALPSLNGLRAFEAMGRLGSATRAAEELNVTHSAVSRQVKALEASLGLRLFEGPRHRLTLTSEGQRLLGGLSVGFDALSEAVRAARAVSEVTLAVHASLAVKWLIPRLGQFERDHPGIAVHLRDLPIAAVREREADLVVRFLDGPALSDSRIERLVENRIGLVCTPALVDRLETAPRLIARSHGRGWSDWLAASGVHALGGPARELSHLHYTLDAALAGLGAAVLPWVLVANAVEGGGLIAPFGFHSDGGWLVAAHMRGDPARPIREVVRWLRARAEETAARVPI